jgi:signal transduction histidine kinase/ActR/RegA family two-component response regulator
MLRAVTSDERVSGTPAAEREPAPPDAELILTHWRERVLRGVIYTALIGLIPSWGVQYWQARHGMHGAAPGARVALFGIAALALLALWRARYVFRAGVFIGIGCVVSALVLSYEGFSPAQCVMVCFVTMISALFFSLRAAVSVVVLHALLMLTAAYLYSHDLLRPIGVEHMDVRQPINWLRIGMYTLVGSAIAALATGYLIAKLRESLRTQSALVQSLRAEIAQRKLALSELERTQAQLLQAQKLEAVGQLAAGIAHDFNNTLSVITLEAELIKRQQRGEQATRSADALLAAALRGRQLTQQLLLFSRPRTGERESIDAAETLAECVDGLRRLLPSEITFELDIAAGPLSVSLHPSELQQLVLNLGINARDAMTGPGTVRVTLTRQQLTEANGLGLPPGPYVCFTCRDTGSGMSPATLQRVFEPFFSTKAPGRGTGLGLTNVWNIAQRAGGTVRVESELGHGTIFNVYLPLQAASTRRKTERPSQPTLRRGHETVLVVEDDIRLRALLVTLLIDAGYTVLDAANVDAALALERAHTGTLDLVCTDVVMPGRPVRELIAELRARRPRAAILICSGYSEDEQIARGIRSGEFKLLDKPFTQERLLAAVRAALEPARDAPRESRV